MDGPPPVELYDFCADLFDYKLQLTNAMGYPRVKLPTFIVTITSEVRNNMKECIRTFQKDTDFSFCGKQSSHPRQIDRLFDHYAMLAEQWAQNCVCAQIYLTIQTACQIVVWYRKQSSRVLIYITNILALKLLHLEPALNEVGGWQVFSSFCICILEEAKKLEHITHELRCEKVCAIQSFYSY